MWWLCQLRWWGASENPPLSTLFVWPLSNSFKIHPLQTTGTRSSSSSRSNLMSSSTWLTYRVRPSVRDIFEFPFYQRLWLLFVKSWRKRTPIIFKFWEKVYVIMVIIGRSVRSCSHTIPEKVRNSRPIDMGFKGWEWLLGCSSRTFKPFRYKKFNELAQTANFSVFSRLRQELCAENPQNMEYEWN